MTRSHCVVGIAMWLALRGAALLAGQPAILPRDRMALISSPGGLAELVLPLPAGSWIMVLEHLLLVGRTPLRAGDIGVD